MDHTNHCEQVAKGPMRAKRHVCQNIPDDVFRVLHIIFITTMTVNDVNLYFAFRGVNGLSS